MTIQSSFDTNVTEERLLPSPRSLKESLPVPPKVEELVLSTRSSIRDILDGKDHRKFLIVGLALFTILARLSNMQIDSLNSLQR